MTAGDPRLTPFRPDLAAETLRGIVDAERYVEGERRRVRLATLDLKRQPRRDAALDTQLLFGETVRLFDEQDGWAWVQAERDDYVGYVEAEGLDAPAAPPTHRIVVNRTFIYPAPDMKRPVTDALPLGAEVVVEEERAPYARIGRGYVWSTHLLALDRPATRDPVDHAEGLLGTPYLWGGRTPQGIDCSGLVQLSFAMAGIAMPRDTHRQESVGNALPFGEDATGLTRGDLVFWPGHVAIMVDDTMLLHASGHQMMVCREPLRIVRERVASGPDGKAVSSIRRQTSTKVRNER